MRTINTIARIGLDRRNRSSGYVYLSESEALFARLTGSPTDATKQLIDQTISALKTSGAWDKRDVIFLFCNFDSQASLLNIKANSSNATLHGGGLPVHVAGEYFETDGAATYINTNFAPGSDGVKFQRNDNSSAARILVSSGDADYSYGARSVVPACYYMARLRSANNFAIVNNAGSLSVTSGNLVGGVGFAGMNRADSANQGTVLDGVLGATGAVASSADQALPLFIGCYNLNGNPSGYVAQKFAYWVAGGALSGDEHLAEYNALENFRTNVVATL